MEKTYQLLLTESQITHIINSLKLLPLTEDQQKECNLKYLQGALEETLTSPYDPKMLYGICL